LAEENIVSTDNNNSNNTRRFGKTVKPPEMDELLEDTLVNATGIGKPLTRREAEILKLIISGKTNKEIARRFCRTERTIEYHRNRLMRKFGAHNAAELVKQALVRGLV